MNNAPCDSGNNPYDVVPYIDRAYSFSHPRQLEALATLFGMEPPPITQCRVLELGCAGGGNLIPQAAELPESTFVGVDASKRQIEDAQRDANALGLTNIELRHADIREIDETWGQFDYIISHGVLSWVPPDVQDKLFEVSSRNLAPNGVAFISYNTYPGWHLGAAVRDLMRYHVAQFPDPHKQIEQAKAVLEFLAELSGEKTLWGQLLHAELEKLRKVNNDNYMFHEHLEANNHPMYFYEFLQRAEAHGLQYLADADFSSMLLCHLPEKARQVFAGLPQEKLEQYLDFAGGRRFRRTLLCHKEVAISRQVKPDRLTRLHFALAGPIDVAGVDIRNDAPATFVRGKGRLQTVNRLVKAAMIVLKEVFPRYVSFLQLYMTALARIQQARPAVAGDPRYGTGELAQALLSAFSVELVELCVHPPQVASQPGERPATTPLVRFQAQHERTVTNLRHHPVQLNPLARRLVLRLDGRHDRRDLIECVRECLASGEMTIKHQGEEVSNPDDGALHHILDQTLGYLSSASLLKG